MNSFSGDAATTVGDRVGRREDVQGRAGRWAGGEANAESIRLFALVLPYFPLCANRQSLLLSTPGGQIYSFKVG